MIHRERFAITIAVEDPHILVELNRSRTDGSGVRTVPSDSGIVKETVAENRLCALIVVKGQKERIKVASLDIDRVLAVRILIAP